MNDQEKRLQDLAGTLPFSTGRFSADDVRVRLGRSARRPARFGLAAAALVALAVTHAGAYLLGSHRGDAGTQSGAYVPAAPSAALQETERILTRASHLDENMPHDVLVSELNALRDDIRFASLPSRLSEVRDRRAPRFVDALAQLEQILDGYHDPGFRVMFLSGIARATLSGDASVKLLPVGTRSYAQVRPLGENRFRVVVLDAARGLLVEDEGTLAELRAQHPEIKFVNGE